MKGKSGRYLGFLSILLWGLLIAFGLFVLTSLPALAQSVFPTDSVNVRADLIGNFSSTTLANLTGTTSTSTVLYESYNTNSSDNTAKLVIACGNTRLLQVNSFSKIPSVERFKYGLCAPNTSIVASVSGTTGSPDTTISLIYIPRNRATTPDPYPYASSTDPSTGLIAASVADTDTQQGYIVIALLVLSALSLVDLIRRLFAPHYK